MWSALVKYFPIFLINGPSGIGLYLASRIPFWIVVAIAFAKSLLFMVCLFYGTTWVVERIRIWRFSNLLLSGWQGMQKRLVNNNLRPDKHLAKKILTWLLQERQWIVILASFVPVVPFLPTASIIAIRVMRVKWGLPILILGIIFKSIIFCWILSPVAPHP